MKKIKWFASIYDNEKEMRRHQCGETALEITFTRTSIVEVSSLNLEEGYQKFTISEEYKKLKSLYMKKIIYVFYFDDLDNIVYYR